MLAKRIENERRKTQGASTKKGREAFKQLLDKAKEPNISASLT